MAAHPSQAEAVAGKTKVSAGHIIDLIQHHLFEAPSLNFSCMVHMLITKNDLIGLDELVLAIQQLDLVLNETDYHVLFSSYQKNWNQPKIEWRRFAEHLRQELTEKRSQVIRDAYTKLDPEQTSKVCLDTIAKSYNVAGAREVAQGQRSEDQHYHTFMDLWCLTHPDDQVSFDMFHHYFDNVSSAYATDDEFVAMMKTCWGL